MMIDRLTPPPFYTIEGLRLIAPETHQWENGLKYFYFEGGDQDLVRIEWIFKHSLHAGENTLLNSCLTPMLLEGTTQRSNAEIADYIDFHGAYLVPEFRSDYSTLTLFSMTRHLPKILPLVYELFTSANFPEKGWETYLHNRKQRLQISLQRNDVLARRTFNKQLFGDTRYGHAPQPEEMDGLEREELIALHQQLFRPDNCHLLIAGRIDPDTAIIIRDIFGGQWTSQEPVSSDLHAETIVFPPNQGKTTVVTIPESLQSAIRLGNHSIQRAHPDFPGLQFVNTILGGYFGSRLMTNIREDKGYTYGIGSGIAVLEKAAFFTIATEVGVDFTGHTLEEIKKEMQTLQQERVSEDEIALVRNYLMGSLLGSLENIFSHADKFKQAYFSGLDLDYFTYYESEILQMNADRIQELAGQYLNYEAMEKIVVGKWSDS